MATLIEKPAHGGHDLPLSLRGVELSALPGDPITSVAPWPGQEKKLSAALKKAVGAAFPAPGESVPGKGGILCLWAGRDMAFVIGALPDGAAEALAPLAALTDQTDGWAGLRLSGPAAEAVLARLVPLDLREAGFAIGATARSTLNHMPLLIWRAGPAEFHLRTFRSMADTAVHELTVAMRGVAARG